ncbi:MAG: phosphoribosyl-ATP diphosphatase [Phototrophicaceae bacterium]
MSSMTLTELEQIILNRKDHPNTTSYTAKLFAGGINKIAQKVGEEATEVVIASLAQTRTDQINELADLFYHTLVLMAQLDLTLEDVGEELNKRHKEKSNSPLDTLS